jgi:hypothetical protein
VHRYHWPCREEDHVVVAAWECSYSRGGCCQGGGAWVLTQRTRQSLPRTLSPSEQQVPSKVSLRRAVDTVQRCGVGGVFEPTIRVWRADHWRGGTTGKQPANLRVKGAEESLSILPDYKPTVRPPPKRC